MTVLDDDGLPVDGERTAAGQERFLSICRYTAATTTPPNWFSVEQDLGEHEEFLSYDPIRVSLPIERRFAAHQAILVAPEGTADGDGTARAPLTPHGSSFAQPGQQVNQRVPTRRPRQS